LTNGGVLLYVDVKSVERNEAGEPFSTAWTEGVCICQTYPA
jgi:hypothetical protein